MEYTLVTNIDAPPETVWNLFTGIEAWPAITASVSEARRADTGPLRVGSEVVIKQPRLPEMRWRVTALDPGRSFEWETAAPGVTIAARHIVEARGAGSTVTLKLAQKGVLAGIVSALSGRLTRSYLEMELEGFRRTAESRVTP